MAALSFLWFLIGVVALTFTAVFVSLRKAFMFFLMWSLPMVGPLVWRDITHHAPAVHDGKEARSGKHRLRIALPDAISSGSPRLHEHD